jgi:hypothetical protein
LQFASKFPGVVPVAPKGISNPEDVKLNFLAYNVETEDVTDKMVTLFHTTDQGWKWAKEIEQWPPVPIEKFAGQNN